MWHRAREAFGLSEATVTGRIEARFALRRLGKVSRFSDETLGKILLQCAADYGKAPRVNEFARWRYRKIELAREAGRQLQIPSATPYRRRWGTWEAALRHHGFSQEEIEARLEL